MEKGELRVFLLASLAFWETAKAAEIEDDGKSALKWRSETAPEPQKASKSGALRRIRPKWTEDPNPYVGAAKN
jgi:hypothetical protein